MSEVTGKGWIGVDLDGTLATYERGQYPTIGDPIPPSTRGL